jgi:hypothetical protein
VKLLYQNDPFCTGCLWGTLGFASRASVSIGNHRHTIAGRVGMAIGAFVSAMGGLGSSSSHDVEHLFAESFDPGAAEAEYPR